MSYAELHAHSAFSFLDGASHPEELALAAAHAGYESFALTDHDNLCGAMEFAVAARQAGIRAIHGAEVSVDAGEGTPRHLTLLVQDQQGWSNLCRLLTQAHRLTRKGTVRREPKASLEEIIDYSGGLACLSGCPGRGVHDEPTLRRLRSAFGTERLFVELQRPFSRHDRARNRELEEMAARLGLATVATGNVHAHERGRAPLQDAFVSIRERRPLDSSEPLRRGNHSHVLASPRAMEARFEGHPEAVRASSRLAGLCRFELLDDLGYRYPGSEDEGADRELHRACQERFARLYPSGHRLRGEAAARLDEELKIISGLGLSGFFLLHRDMLELAREVALEVRGPSSARALLPPGRGRGSSVSSIVCYLTGLSHVDPVANRLLLGRFLSEEITALPDIDLDFPRDVRERLIPRIHERYGRDRSALVAAFPTFRTRGAVRELGFALGLPPAEIERVSRAAEGWSMERLEQDIEAVLGAERAGSQRWRWLVRLAREAESLPRHLAQHSGGMVVATRPLVDCCPVVPSAIEGRQIAMWDKDSCADAGFLKIDLLGLGMLSAVERCVEKIARRRGERIDLSRIDYEDPKVYEAVQAGDTTGVFQIESRAQMASLRRTLPKNLDDLTVQVAIVRPGPIQGGAVNPYIDRRRRLREDPDYEIPYLHESLRPVLEETLGTIIFQDQVIEVAMAFAGFSAGEAEGLRRAMSRKRSQVALEAYHRRFVSGATGRWPDVDEQLAERVFTMIAGFSGFGFPKAHGAAFGLLAYQSTWLRVHYGPEFLAALVDEQPMGFYPPDALVHEAQRRGIKVLPPDVNESAVGTEVDGGGAVRIGLRQVGGVTEADLEELVSTRDRDGRFGSLEELASRAPGSRGSLESLAWAGACDGLARGPATHGRREVLWRLGARNPSGPNGQLTLSLGLPGAPDLEALSPWEQMLADYAATGLTTGTHPLALLRERLSASGAVTSASLTGMAHGSRVAVGGLVVARQRPATARGVCFLLLEDETGTVNLVVTPPVYERFRLAVRTEPLVVATGTLERHPHAGGTINVLTDRMDALKGDSADPASLGHIADAPSRRAADAERELADFRAVAPAVLSFAQGRRR